MRGYLTVGNRIIKSNTLIRREADRRFRLYVDGTGPTSPQVGCDLYFTGDHTFDETNVAIPHIEYFTELAGGVIMSEAGEVMRHRYKQSVTFEDFPDSTNRIAFAVGRAYVNHAGAAGSPQPAGLMSVRDFDFNEIGNTYGHPTGRRAFFPETAITTAGFGLVTIGGTLALSASEDGHYIYLVRISEAGDDTGAKYFFQRRPWHVGAYEAGAGETDFVIGSGSDTLSARWSNNSERALLRGMLPIPDGATSPTEAEISWNIEYPTAAAQTNNTETIITGMVCTDEDPARVWYCCANAEATTDVDIITSRSIWSWDRMSGLAPIRRDADDPIHQAGMTNMPTLSTTGVYRDLAKTRGGLLLAAVDADDDANTGADEGALLVIDPAANDVVSVHGASAITAAWNTTYTVGGMLQNNALRVLVDTSENYAAAGSDRIWVAHRNGWSYADIVNSTGVISSWTTVSDSGASVNIIAANSERYIAGHAGLTTGWTQTGQQPHLSDMDSSGDIYYISAAGGYTAGQQRLNRLLGDASAHSWYTISNAAEPSATGFIEIGQEYALTTHVISAVKCQRRDSGDPEADTLWLATGYGSAGNDDKLVCAIPVDEWGGGNNPGAAWYGDEIDDFASAQTWGLKVAPDGQAWLYTPNTGIIGVLETLGRETTWSGTIDQFDAAAGGLQTIHRDTGSGDSFTDKMIGKRIRIPAGGPTSAVNAGSFVVDSVTNGDTLVIRNASGVSSSTGEAADWDFAGAEFDTRNTTAGAVGSWSDLTQVNTMIGASAYDWWVDNSGIAYVWQPLRSGSTDNHNFQMHLAPTWQWSGMTWYRSRVPHNEAAAGRTAATTAQSLSSGVTVEFLNQNSGTDEFLAGEYYTCVATRGISKDPTQEFTYKYEFYNERTDLIDELSTDKTATNGTARGGYRDGEDLTVNDPVSTPLTYNSTYLAHHQRQLFLDGSNNTPNAQISAFTSNTTTGFSMGLDLGASVVAEQLIFGLSGESNNNFFPQILIDLYSSSDNVTYELRSSYAYNTDNPEWMINVDAFHEDKTGSTQLNNFNRGVNVEIDLAELEANNAFVGATTTNAAQRYWKLVFRSAASATNVDPKLISAVAYDAAGDPLGMPAAKHLGTANDSNYLANYVIRATWRQDNNSQAGGTTDGSGTTITLNSGAFDIDILENDYFRELDGSGNIVQEHVIDSRDSNTQLTLKTAAVAFTGSNWEVARNADVRPRDDEGGGEDQARFPAQAGEVYICPVTGWIYYHADDVTDNRILRIDRYVKVKRSL